MRVRILTSLVMEAIEVSAMVSQRLFLLLAAFTVLPIWGTRVLHRREMRVRRLESSEQAMQIKECTQDLQPRQRTGVEMPGLPVS